MNEQQNVKVVQDAYAAFGRRDIEALIGMMSNDIDWLTLGPKELPMSGPRRGKPEVQKFFQQVEESWNFERFEPREFIAQGETVVALGFYGGTAKTTKRTFACEWSHVFTVRNGKVTKFREYTDTANLLNAYAPSAVKVG
jgi:ketosteroid isomerase-like protein